MVTFTAVSLASVIIQGQASSAEQHVAALKQSLQTSQARLRQYEWIETTVISLKGEEKARTQNRCYYGADGKLQKVPIGDKPAQASASGRRGGRVMQQVVEKKKSDMQDYMERAVKLVQQYVPPDPQQVQAAKDAGKLALRPTDAGLRIELTNYLKAGDVMTIEVDPKTDRLLGVTVSSYLDKPDDKVKLDVHQGAFPDGTIYTDKTTLDAPAKNIRVVIENSGYRPIGK